MTPPVLKKIYDQNCTRCELHTNALHVCIPASGRLIKHRALIVGEAPGRNEDEQNAPFVGRAGWLLDRELLRLGLTRRDIPVTNAVKCRPTSLDRTYNLTPQQTDIDTCVDAYLTREIEALDVWCLLALGNVAASALLGTTGISMLRDSWHVLDSERERWVRVTYHPAYVLRQGLDSEIAQEFRQDIKFFADECRKEGHVTRTG